MPTSNPSTKKENSETPDQNRTHKINNAPPEPADHILFRCPECKGKLRAEVRGAGQNINCPICFKPIKIPTLPQNSSSSFAAKKARSNHHPWRRFFARTVDLYFLGLIHFFLFSDLVGDLFPQYIDSYVKAIQNPIFAGLLFYITWIPVEAAFISSFATTPAKWIFGIRIIKSAGKNLSYFQALMRTVLVWIQGDGLGIYIIPLFTRLFAYSRLTKTGTTLWDATMDCAVIHKKWGFVRAISAVFAVIAMLIVVGVLNSIGN